MSHTFHMIDTHAEASHVSVQAVPGAVFLRLRREFDGEVFRRMFVELTLEEARELHCELARCMEVASA
jgi:hypothetical protein